MNVSKQFRFTSYFLHGRNLRLQDKVWEIDKKKFHLGKFKF